MQGNSTGGEDKGGRLDLMELATRLVVEGMPIQRVIGEEAGVSQSTVSRAIHRRIKGDSPGARRLWDYADQRVRLLEAEDGRASTDDPVSEQDIQAGQSATRQRRRARSPERIRRGGVPSRASDANEQSLVDQAVQGLRDYLEDRFDPSLVIEQLAVLRRAQDGGRRARPAERRRAAPRD